jgi:hypothetical protein
MLGQAAACSQEVRPGDRRSYDADVSGPPARLDGSPRHSGGRSGRCSASRCRRRPSSRSHRRTGGSLARRCTRRRCTATLRTVRSIGTGSPPSAFCGFTGFDVRQDRRGEFGWYLAPRFWGRGYATEISSLFLAFGFENLGLPAILATCDPANLASRRVLEKSGLSLADEETVDTWQGERQRLRFIITADEWPRSQQ